MSSLFGLLDLGGSAIQAQNAGIATAANNSANVNTEGYTRQRVDLRANLGSPVYGGVTFGDPLRVGDELLAGRQRDIGGSSGYFDRLSTILLDLEGVMTAAEGDIPAGLGELFGNLNNVASSPLDPQVREAAVASAERLAFAFRQQADEVTRSREDADERVRDTASEASGLSSEIAKLNQSIQLQNDPVLLDQRDQFALRLAELVGGQARIDDDGQMRFLLDNGSVLVDGARSASIEASVDTALGGFSRVEVVDGPHRLDITRKINSGELGADLHFRDTVTSDLVVEIDQLAFDVATNLNAVHRAGQALNGTTGQDLFVEPLAVSGAATSFEVNSVLSADAVFLASGTVGQAVGDNGGMLALLNTKEQLLASGGTRTFVEESVRFISNIGQDVRASVVDQKFHDAQRNSIEALRDSVSGVSLEEELNRLSQFQHASEANMRFVQTIDQMLSRMIDTL
ncbi:MAG: flagellar hook-associated protein FlgK [Myxococcales bacterium]|nr:flagellar hook-associated protein FlgK [Myxococcales bacterium]